MTSIIVWMLLNNHGEVRRRTIFETDGLSMLDIRKEPRKAYTTEPAQDVWHTEASGVVEPTISLSTLSLSPSSTFQSQQPTGNSSTLTLSQQLERLPSVCSPLSSLRESSCSSLHYSFVKREELPFCDPKRDGNTPAPSPLSPSCHLACSGTVDPTFLSSSRERPHSVPPSPLEPSAFASSSRSFSPVPILGYEQYVGDSGSDENNDDTDQIRDEHQLARSRQTSMFGGGQDDDPFSFLADVNDSSLSSQPSSKRSRAAFDPASTSTSSYYNNNNITSPSMQSSSTDEVPSPSDMNMFTADPALTDFLTMLQQGTDDSNSMSSPTQTIAHCSSMQMDSNLDASSLHSEGDPLMSMSDDDLARLQRFTESSAVSIADPGEEKWRENLNLAAAKLQEVEHFLNQAQERTENIRRTQSQLRLPADQNACKQLRQEEEHLINISDQASRELHVVLEQIVLEPRLLVLLYTLQLRVSVLNTQLRLYLAELEDIMSPGNSLEPTCFARLVVVKQPFPKSLKRNTKASTPEEENTVVRLLKGARQDVQIVSKVKAVIWQEDFSGRRDSFELQNEEQEMSDENEASFGDLRFMEGTRLKMVRVQFGCRAQFRDREGAAVHETCIESNTTAPFVVMTNENQWDNSEGMLLKRDIFEGRMEATWAKFANTLQFHYLRSIRQNPAHPDRPLSRYDLEYILNYRFNGSATIGLKDFDSFWDWFGKVLHRVRHQKLFGQLWNIGAIYGFISKDRAEKLLQNETNGTFIIRFSERCPGRAAVAYVKQDPVSFRNEVKHYLVEQPTKETNIADVFKGQRQWSYLLQLKCEFAPSGGNIRCKVRKDIVLEDFYTKRNKPNIEGYEKEIE